MKLDFFKAVVSLLLVVHIKDLSNRRTMPRVISRYQKGLSRLTLISLSATNTLSSCLFARNTYENFPWPAHSEVVVK